MTKKIAVIGCSFSAYWQGDDIATPNMDVITWSNLLKQNFDVTIDMYAQDGLSCGQVLHHISYFANNPNLEYDLILGNLAPLSRDWGWCFNKKSKAQDFDDTMEIANWYVKKPLDDRIYACDINAKHYVHSHKNGVICSYGNGEMSSLEEEYIKKHMKHSENNYILNSRKNLMLIEIAREYYAKKLPLVFWHHLDNIFTDKETLKYCNSDVDWLKIARHNIIHEAGVKSFLENMLGEEKNIGKKFTTDGSHLNSYGHEQLLEKYILTDPTISSILLNK